MAIRECRGGLAVFFPSVLATLLLAVNAGAAITSVSGDGASWHTQLLDGGSNFLSVPGGPLLPPIGSGPFSGTGSLAHSGVSVATTTRLDIAALLIQGLVQADHSDAFPTDSRTGLGKSLIDFVFELDANHNFELSSLAASLAPYPGTVSILLDGLDFTPAFGTPGVTGGLLSSGPHTLKVNAMTGGITGSTPLVPTSLDFQLKLTPVPEPNSFGLAIVGGLAALGWRRVARG